MDVKRNKQSRKRQKSIDEAVGQTRTTHSETDKGGKVKKNC